MNKEIAILGSHTDLDKLVSPEAQETREKKIADLREMWKVVDEFKSLTIDNAGIHLAQINELILIFHRYLRRRFKWKSISPSIKRGRSSH